MYRKSTLQQNHPKKVPTQQHIKPCWFQTNKEIGINNIYAIYLTKGGYCVNIRILNKNDVNEFRELRLKGLKTDATAFGSTYEREKWFYFGKI